jgi:hypothetical protein
MYVNLEITNWNVTEMKTRDAAGHFTMTRNAKCISMFVVVVSVPRSDKSKYLTSIRQFLCSFNDAFVTLNVSYRRMGK